MLPIYLLAHVGPLNNVFSNPSSFQRSQLLVFCSRDLPAATDLVQILPSHLGSPCLGPLTTPFRRITVRPKKPSDLIPWAQKIEFESCK